MPQLNGRNVLQAPSRLNAKEHGAYYTDAHIAEFLASWAIRDPRDVVLDPSFGGGVFLRAASRRIRRLGGQPCEAVWGVELDPVVHAEATKELREEFGLSKARLICANFFDLELGDMAPTQAVIGNPPFIRYQRFSGESREKALRRAADATVSISSLASSWAPFVIHCVSMLKAGGRLAMVVPMEISYTSYARSLLGFLRSNFRRLTLLTFRKRLFQALNEDTALLLAEEKRPGEAEFFVRDLEDAVRLRYLSFDQEYRICDARRLDSQAVARGEQRIIEHLIPESARLLYRSLQQYDQVSRLGELADVGIGYVTGANEFFHLTPDTAAKWQIPEEFLKPAVRRGRSINGVRFTLDDWQQGLAKEDTSYLLHISPNADVSDGLKAYLEIGTRAGVPKAYKCRTRTPWYSVPHVYKADAFLAVMSGGFPRMVENEAKAVGTNSLHVVRFHPGLADSGKALSLLWQTSLTRLSAEIEGHSLGGGMLKLEPTEAERVLVPCMRLSDEQTTELGRALDALLRAGREKDALALADEALLVRGLGLSRRECVILREVAEALQQRRRDRGIER